MLGIPIHMSKKNISLAKDILMVIDQGRQPMTANACLCSNKPRKYCPQRPEQKIVWIMN